MKHATHHNITLLHKVNDGDSGGSTGGEGEGSDHPPPRLGPKKFIARPKNTHICKPPFACQNVLKLTYSNLEFQNFPGEDPRTPSSKGGKGREGRRGRGKGREGGRGGTLDISL